MDEMTYRITDVGREACESRDRNVPAEYRRILWAMHFKGNAYGQHLAARYSPELLAELLGEMAKLGLVEVGSAVGAPPADPDSTLIPPTARAASDDLDRVGCYLAEDRIATRAPFDKSASQTDVLIVEDDPDQLALADLRATMAGYRVRLADSIAAFRKSIAEKGPPDVLLLDVMLTDGNGFDLLTSLRKDRACAGLPVVLLTAKKNVEDIEKGFSLGADGYITKPYSNVMLADVIRRVLRQS